MPGAERVQGQAEQLDVRVLLLERGQPVLGGEDDVDAGRARRRPPAAVSTTAAPQLQTPSSTAAVCQCTGRATATVLPGPTSNSSWSRLAVLATQLSSVVADSSTRSPVESS